MREIHNLKEIRLFSQRAKCHGRKIGLVPTMGALHEGHLSLVAEAKKRSDVVIVSIFVNPIQFGPGEDYARYPRDLRRDKKLLKEVGIDALFVPRASDLFPEGFKTFVEVEGLSKKMCGHSRPTHFRGVATMVAKLFNLIIPDLAFFGEKDYQQQLIVRQMARDLDLPIEIVALPTVREFGGLAMSSRNAYLSPKERKSAAVLYRALSLAKEDIENGERDPRKITLRMRSLVGSEPSVRLDYVVIADPGTLEEAKELKGSILIALAAYLGKTRLIDNVLIEAR
jgi:pantoate--beta-alanine ligase